jgi:hypothetical protein
MHRSTSFSALAVALSAAAVTAQITATYATFGAGCAGTGTGLGAAHILPAIAATSFGSGNAIPFGWTPNKFQQVFLGTELPAACTLAAVMLRGANQFVHAPNYVVDMDIQVGYTTRAPGTLNTTFASNWDAGAPVTVLPRSQVPFPDHVQPTSPTDFRVSIPWTSTFAWVPAPGRNLLVEVTVYGNSYGNQIYGWPVDNVSGTHEVWGTPATATTGQVRSFGPAMSFVEQTNTALPQLFSTDTPQINNQFRVRLSQCRPSSFAILLLGLSDTWWNSAPLPLDLGSYGAPGCSLLMAPDDKQILLLNSAGAANLQYSIPNNIYLLNMHFYNQALVADAPANALGFAVTNGGVGLLGNQ